MRKIEIDKLIEAINRYDETLFITFKKGKLLSNSICFLNSEDEIIEDKENVVIGLYQLRDIIENLRLQKANFSLDEVIEALNFYLENDAFIEVEKLGFSN